MSITALEGTFGATGQSSSVALQYWFNVSLSDFGTATVAVERSFDSGSTWVVVEEFTTDVQRRGYEPEEGVLYRFNCSAYTSGTISYRFSK